MPVSYSPVMITCKLNNKDINFELDSGSHVSTIQKSDAIRMGGMITPTKYKIVGYSGNEINLTGEIDLNIEYCGKSLRHTFLVVNSGSVNLFGRDLFSKFEMKVTCPLVNNIKIMY